MNDIESRLADGMRHIADEPGGPPPTQALLVRGRKARRRGRVTWMGSACLVVAALVAVPIMVQENRQTPPPDPAKMRLVAALSSSENISYRLKLTSIHTDENGRSWVFDGAFDPRTRTGHLTSVRHDPAGPYEQRLVEGTVYISHLGRPFQIMPDKVDRLQFSLVSGGGLAGTADPQELFRTLKKDDATVTQTGPAGYHFEADVAPSLWITGGRLVGDVTINGDNRIETITYQRTVQTRLKSGDPLTLTEAFTVEFSAYGEPVTVERPANAVPASPRSSRKPWVEISPAQLPDVSPSGATR